MMRSALSSQNQDVVAPQKSQKRQLGAFGGGESADAIAMPAFLTAKNNVASNRNIVYSRLVQINKQHGVEFEDGKTYYEYDHLEAGELNCIHIPHILQLTTQTNANLIPISAANVPMPKTLAPHATSPTAVDLSTDAQKSNIPRVASITWLMRHFSNRLGRQTIDLRCFDLCGYMSLLIDEELGYWSKRGLVGSNMFDMVDIAHVYAQDNAGDDAATGPSLQGIFCMGKSAFLETFDDRTSKGVVLDHGALVPEQTKQRNLGSSLAIRALDCALRENGLKSWSPDGVCMSVFGREILEGQTGEKGQNQSVEKLKPTIFVNSGISGPCITTSWAHSDDALQCSAGDSLFVLIVADLHYVLKEVSNSSGLTPAQEHAKTMRRHIESMRKSPEDSDYVDALCGFRQSLEDGVRTRYDAQTEESCTKLEKVYEAWLASFRAYTEHLAESEAAQRKDAELNDLFGPTVKRSNQPSEQDNELKDLMAKAKRDWNDYRNLLFPDVNTRIQSQHLDVKKFNVRAQQLRAGELAVASAKLSNFRLKKSRSSYLDMFSGFHGANGHKTDVAQASKHARCGLPMTFQDDDKSPSGVSAVIIGGWRVGSVIDSEATRSLSLESKAKSGAASVNLNVNVEWWSAERLYARFGN